MIFFDENDFFDVRVANNGDTANKIGTYSLAVLAKYHKYITCYQDHPHYYVLEIYHQWKEHSHKSITISQARHSHETPVYPSSSSPSSPSPSPPSFSPSLSSRSSPKTRVPFYIAMPMSTLDRNCPTGQNIPIEQVWIFVKDFPPLLGIMSS